MNTATDDRRARWLAFALAALTFILFIPTWGDKMLYWDDNINVLENPLVLAPGWHGLKIIFTSIFSTDYYPITYISLAIDHWIWGGNFAGYHVTQTLLHAINAGLVLLLVWRWTKNLPVAMVVAAIFAWHPVQVESVAWIAERKNLLGTCFVLLAWLAYLRAEEQPRWRLGAVFFFLLAALSHALVIVMPVMLILYEICIRQAAWKSALQRTWLFFVPAAFAAWMRVAGHHESGQLVHNFSSVWVGVLTMTKVLGEYLNTLVWPMHLNNYYVERFVPNLRDGGVWLAVGWLALWFVVIGRVREHRRWAIFGLGWFLAALLPVMQLVPHPTVRADRYLYSAMLGPLLVGALVISRWPALLKLVGICGAIGLASLTLARFPAWQDSRALWTDSVSKNPHSAMAHYSLAGCLSGDNDWAGAEVHARQAVAINPDFADGQERLGGILLALGKTTEARDHLERALTLNPNLPEARHNLALIKSADQ